MPPHDVEKWLEELRNPKPPAEPQKYKSIHAPGRCYLCGKKAILKIKFKKCRMKTHSYCSSCYSNNQIFMVTRDGHQRRNYY